jgi:hypothetical protein
LSYGCVGKGIILEEWEKSIAKRSQDLAAKNEELRTIRNAPRFDCSIGFCAANRPKIGKRGQESGDGTAILGLQN